MSEVSVQTLSSETVVSTVLAQLNQKQIEDATTSFATDFRYKDHGIGLEFTNKERLTEFFRKMLELYPDSFFYTGQHFANGEHVITQWTLEVTITEPFYAGLTRKVPISLPGVSIVRVDNGKIVDWVDYYDGLTARRTALAAHFTEWIEY
jgi:steroid delta-isomerase-like uncharacterized protein